MRVELQVVLLIIVILCVGASSSIPDCQNHRVMFVTEPSGIEVALTAHSVAQFSCRYTGERESESTVTLEWIINSKRYNLTELPANHIIQEFQNGNILHVTNITSKDNNTLYQCQILTGGKEKQNQCAYRSKIGKLTINGYDSVHNFIHISFDKATSSINCTFINQSRKSEKYCLVRYGTAIPRCQLFSQVKGHVSNSNSISLHLNLEDTTTICYNVEAGNQTKTVRVGGSLTFAPLASENKVLVYIVAFVSVVIILLSILVIIVIVIYCIKQPKKSYDSPESPIFNGDSSTEKKEKYTPQLCEEPPLQIHIDRSIAFYTIHMATDICLMYKFTTELYPDYQPQDGFGYYQLTNEEIMSISPHKRVILMEEDNPSLPKLITTISSIRQRTAKQQKSSHVYAQDRSFTRTLNSGSKILCYFHSEVVTAYSKIFAVTESHKEIKHIIPHHKPEWIRYGYFEFTNPECIKPHQRVIAMKQDGTLVTGPGIRHLVGATGDGSTLTMPPAPSDINDIDENDDHCAHDFKHVFIQSKENDRMLVPGTKYLFCAMMDEVREYYAIYDVHENCNMESFGSHEIPGFTTKRGYGYYEFTEPEYIKPHRNVILKDKKGRLFTGAGARFFYTGCEYDMDAVLKKKKVSPPNLGGTEWVHIFVQSHSKIRILKRGTKFLYCEHKVA